MIIGKSAKNRIIVVLVLALLVCAVFCLHLYSARFVPDPNNSGWRDRGDAIFYRGEAILASTTISKSPYDPDRFYRDGEFLLYDDPQYNCRIGVDVSTYQGDIDWQQVKDSGVDFAIIRAGYRGYTAGSLNVDDEFYDNMDGALAAGLDVGVYFYSQAINAEEAVQEADYVLSLIEGYDVKYPIVFDWEPVYSSDSRSNDMDGDILTDCCIAFADRIIEAGRTPLIYFYKDIAYYQLDLERLTDYGWWLAEYNEVPNFFYDYEMLQYTCTGSIPGIDGDVDINLSFYDYAA